MSLPLEKVFENIIKRSSKDAVLNPIIAAMEKHNYSIVETEPLLKKENIHYMCNVCKFVGKQRYKNLIVSKPRCDCPIDNAKIVNSANDILGIKKYETLFKKLNLEIVPDQPFDGKRIHAEFDYKCKQCNDTITMTLNDLIIHSKQYTGHKGCQKCAENDQQVYLSLEDAFSNYLKTDTYENVVQPIENAMHKFNFSIAVNEPITSKERIQHMCNSCKFKGVCSYSALLIKGDCNKCSGHKKGGPKPIVITCFQDILAIPEYKKMFDKSNYIVADDSFKEPKIISSAFYFECKECHYKIGPNPLSYINTSLANIPDYGGCSQCKKNDHVYITDRCECGKIVAFCDKCGGSALCKDHGKNKYACSICRPPGRYCIHDIIKVNCRTCGHKFYCEHNCLRYRCKVCSPGKYLLHLLRCQINKPARLQYVKKNKHTYEYLDCSIQHLFNVFNKYYNVPKLTSEYHVDHIKPLSKFDFTKEGELEKALHWTNLQPLGKKQNLQKFNKWSPELEEWWDHEIQHKLEQFSFTELGTDESNQVMDDFLEMIHDIILNDEDSKLYEYIKTIQDECDRTFIKYTDDGYVFECNKCKIQRPIVNVQHLSINKNECASCVQRRVKYTFDDIKQFVDKSDLKLEMTESEYRSKDEISVSCKHGIKMVKTLRNIQDNKGCSEKCKEEKRMASRKKNMK